MLASEISLKAITSKRPSDKFTTLKMDVVVQKKSSAELTPPQNHSTFGWFYAYRKMFTGQYSQAFCLAVIEGSWNTDQNRKNGSASRCSAAQ